MNKPKLEIGTELNDLIVTKLLGNSLVAARGENGYGATLQVWVQMTFADHDRAMCELYGIAEGEGLDNGDIGMVKLTEDVWKDDCDSFWVLYDKFEDKKVIWAAKCALDREVAAVTDEVFATNVDDYLDVAELIAAYY